MIGGLVWTPWLTIFAEVVSRSGPGWSSALRLALPPDGECLDVEDLAAELDEGQGVRSGRSLAIASARSNSAATPIGAVRGVEATRVRRRARAGVSVEAGPGVATVRVTICGLERRVRGDDVIPDAPKIAWRRIGTNGALSD